jgi:hypothetical protein
MGVHYLADEERTVSLEHHILVPLTNLCLGNFLHCCSYWSNLRLSKTIAGTLQQNYSSCRL